MKHAIILVAVAVLLSVAHSLAHAQGNPCIDIPDWPCDPLPAFNPAVGVDCDEPGNGPGDLFPGYPTNLTPLTEFDPGQTYGGQPGRLYTDGSTPTNIPPPVLGDHLACMSEAIEPVGPDSDPIVFMIFGVSNTNQQAAVAQLMTQQRGIQSDRVIWVNGAKSGIDLCQANDNWPIVLQTQRERLEAAGITAQAGGVYPQVQAAWVRYGAKRDTCPGYPPDFPANASFFRAEMASLVYDRMLVHYPNLKVIYFSSSPLLGHHFAEFSDYELAWGVRMLIEDHVSNLDGDACDTECVATSVNDPLCEGPALAWGPYLWVNGNCLADPEETVDGRLNGVDYSTYYYTKEDSETNCRPNWEGLENSSEVMCGWDCDAWQDPAELPGCNVHPSPIGEQKVAGLLVDFLQHNEHTAMWYPVQPDETTGRRIVAASEDAWTDESAPTAPGANGDTRYLFSTPGTNNDAKHAFMKFRIPAGVSADGLVRVALMLMVGEKVSPLPGTIYYTTDTDDNSWTETTLDWDWEAANINLNDLQSFSMPSTGGRGAMVNIDVTAIIRDAIAAAKDDLTFIYVSDSECPEGATRGCTLYASELHDHEINEWHTTSPYAGPRLIMVTSCQGDANRDGVVDPLDTGFVLARFGCSVESGDPDCQRADQNEDGEVDPLDAGFVLARLGQCL
ncbi:MAG: hypothetical protein IID37_10970 [Planctomycetes bacterium]|nr:hypothetical protein [Planctomycetota bacterium]